jgi:hypothetical protein
LHRSQKFNTLLEKGIKEEMNRFHAEQAVLQKDAWRRNLLYGAGQGALMPRVRSPDSKANNSKVWGAELKAGKKNSQVRINSRSSILTLCIYMLDVLEREHFVAIPRSHKILTQTPCKYPRLVAITLSFFFS